ncbi:MAG: MMPL family transporter [Rhodospirillales bacterium]|nr:MMPL family transporter [Rhodospirillales bacterium]
MTAASAGRPRALPILLALCVALLAAGAALSQCRIRTDMAALLPRGDGPAARFMLRELRSGPANRLVLIGIEGAPAGRLAAASRALAARLEKSGAVILVRNGARTLSGSPEERFLFAHRYLLSPAVRPEAFTVPALRADLKRLLRGLQSSAAPLVARFGLADPTGAFLKLAQAWTGGSRIGLTDGVWFAAGRPASRPRALLVAETRAGGTDLTGQRQALDAIRAQFAAVAPPGARLVLGGTAVLSQAAERAVRADAERLSILSTLIVALLLLWRFRRPLVIAAILIPIVLGLGAAALAVQVAYGSVQGIAFGFGMTMLGVSVDYPVLLVGHRKRGEAPPATFRRIGHAFAMAAATAMLGLSGMVFAGFPAIGQLGLFALTGLGVAALATGFLLPPLIVAADLAPMAFGDPALLHRVERWRRLRPLGGLAIGLALLVLAVAGGPVLARSLAALNPVPAAALAADAGLRAELGAPDAGQLGLVRGSSAEAVLVAEERLHDVLAGLQAEGKITGVEDAADLWPSRATQRARQAALPPADVLARRLAAASAGLGFRPQAFAPFLAAVAAARAAAPLGPDAVSDPVLAARLSALLFPQARGRTDGRPGPDWYGLIAPAGVTDPPAVAARLRAAGVLYVDVAAETARIVSRSTRGALHRLAWGGMAAFALLVVGLRRPKRVLRVAGSVLGALLVAVAVLTAAGVRFSLLQIVGLQFAAGVGLDYALFFARPQLDADERARTLRTLLTCNAMTLLTFGLLATARTPLLRQIGVAVVTGALASIIMAFLFAGPRPAPPADAPAGEGGEMPDRGTPS